MTFDEKVEEIAAWLKEQFPSGDVRVPPKERPFTLVFCIDAPPRPGHSEGALAHVLELETTVIENVSSSEVIEFLRSQGVPDRLTARGLELGLSRHYTSHD